MTVNTQELRELVEKAIQRAYYLGQEYWRLADSESWSDNRRSFDTQDKFDALRSETVSVAGAKVAALLDEIDALRAELQARQWQPIETAPVGQNPAGAFWCLLAYGPDDDQSISHGFRWHGKWFAAGTFYRLGQERLYELREAEVHPTHWMPMPELPDDLPPAPPQGETA